MILKLKKYKVRISPDSAEINTLQAGDIVNRQYFDGKSTIYTLMYVDSVGVDVVDKDGVKKDSPYFIGQLIYGDEPKTGELLNFVRVTSLSNSARGGALYLTSSDSDSPYMDVIDVVDRDNAVFILSGTGGMTPPNSKVTHIQNTDEYFTEIISDLGGDGLLFSVPNGASKSKRDVVDPVLLGFMSIKPSKDTDMEIFGSTFKLKGGEYNDIFIPLDSSDMMGSHLPMDIHLTNIGSVGDSFYIKGLIFVSMASMTGFSDGVKVRVGQLSGVIDEHFGALDSYGAYFQKLYATKDVNIAGTLSAGSKDGQQAVFYVGKIRTNAFTNSLKIEMKDNPAEKYTYADNPVGIGEMYRSKKDTSFYANKDKLWHLIHAGSTVCFSMFVMSLHEKESVTLNIGENDIAVKMATNGWNRVYFYFSLPEDAENTVITIKDADVAFCAPQLEFGVHPTIYQPTDEVSLLDYGKGNPDYGMWATKGGFGGTIQNPVVSITEEGVFIGDAIQATRGGVKIDLKKTGISDAIDKRAIETETRFEIKEGQISSTVTQLETSLAESKTEVEKAQKAVKDAESIKTSSEQDLLNAKEELKKAQDVANSNTASTGQAKADAEQAVKDAQKKVDDAQVKANEAATEAAKAKAEADKAALSQADVTKKQTEIIQTAEEIKTTATKVTTDAETAAASATKATAEATKSATNAANAKTDALSAKTQATNAQTKALEATAKAEEALASAGASSESYLKAKTEAELAVKEAEKATEQAILSQTKADLATEEAAKAKAEADKAALAQKDVTLKQTEIKQTASEIKLSAKEVSDNTAKATEASATATKKATEATSQAELAQVQATEATAKALEADKKAQEALASAGSSSTSYQNAKKEADKAKIDATTANTKALEAKKEADRSKVEADKALASQKVITEKEASINVTAENIELKATEVTKNAETATAQAELATKKATEATTASTNATKKATEADMKAKEANAKAEEALISAGASSEAYANAKLEAEKANKDALKANSEADKAQVEAKKAKTEADKAAQTLVTITAKESSINATAEGVEIKAKESRESADRAVKAETSINVKADGIVMQASSKSAKKAIDELEIGGRNLLLNSGNFGTTVNNWSNNGGGLVIDTVEKYNGYNTIRTTVGNGIKGSWYKLENGKEYTYSALIKSSEVFTGSRSIPIHYHAGLNNVHQAKIQVLKFDTSYTTSDLGKYKLLYIVFKLTKDADSFLPMIYLGSGTRIFNIAYLKLEKGNKATDWTPAPEDQQDELNKQITSVRADFQIKEGQISSTVTKLESSLEESKKEVAKAEQTVKDAESIKTSSEQELKDAKDELKKAQEVASSNTTATGQAKDDAEQAVRDAQKKVEDAQSKVDLATVEAAKAKLEADKAIKAQADVALKQTEINQTSEAITLTATEVSENSKKAIDASTTATAKANEASSNAAKAKTDAATANTKAIEANKKAEEAKASAGTSSKAYQDAKAEAVKANADATKANAEATKSANEAAKAKLEADKATKASADIALKQTEINQTAEAISLKATEVSSNTTKAEEEAKKAQASATTAQTNATNATNKAKEAQDNATKTKADAAASNQSKLDAQKKADEAKAEAIKANADAAKALTEANRAKVEADKALASQKVVTQKETAINQTASKVEISAKRSEDSATRSEKAEASINVKADGIVMEASQKASDKAIDGLEIGGRNYLIGDKTGSSIEPKEYMRTGYFLEFGSNYSLEVGEKYIFSVFVQVLDEHGLGSSNLGLGKNPLHFNIDYSKGVSSVRNEIIDKDKKIYKYTYTIDFKEPVWEDNQHYFAYRIRRFGTSKKIVSNVWGAKLEKGNKATDWTPAPEDIVQESVTKSEAKLIVTANEIRGEVNANKVDADGKITGLNTRVTQTEKSITSKVSQTEYDANNKAIGTKISAIEQKSDSIELSVKNAEKKIDGLEIGGRNLFTSKSKIINAFVGNGSAGDGNSKLNIINGRRSVVIPITEGKPYSISYDVLGENGRFSFGFYKQYEETETSSPVGWFNWSNHSKNRFESYIAPNGYKYLIIYFGHSDKELPPQLMVEQSTKCSSWTPAPEDIVQESVTKSEAKLIVTANEIRGEVNANKVDADGKITGLNTRVTQTEKSITSKVSQTEYDANNKAIGTKISAIEQKSDSIELSVKNAEEKIDGLEIGGRNLVGLFSDIYTGTSASAGYGAYFIRDGYEFNAKTSYPAFAYKVIVPPSTTLTLSLDLEIDMINPAAWFQLISNYVGGGTSASSSLIQRSGKHSFTFTSNANGEVNRIGFRAWDNTAQTSIRVTNVKLEKGNKPTDWSPAPEDVVKESVSKSEAKLIVTANEIRGEVNANKVDADGKITGLNSRVTQTEKSITSKVSQTEYDANNKAVGTKISAIEQKSDSIELSVKNLGAGTNIIKGSYNWLWQESDTGKNTISSYKDPLGNHVNKITISEASSSKINRYTWLYNYEVFEKGEFYTVSFEYRTNISDANMQYYYRHSQNNIVIKLMNTGESWAKASGTFQIDKNITTSPETWRHLLTAFFNNPKAGETLEVRSLMLERGMTATGYTPAWQDYGASLALTKDGITMMGSGGISLIGKVTFNMMAGADPNDYGTIIDGGTIKTKYLNAQQIVSVGVTADTLKGKNIIVDTGKIGGWKITNNTIENTNIVLEANGGIRAKNGKWMLAQDGSAKFTSGEIGGWNIKPTHLSSDKIILDPTGGIRNTAGMWEFNPDGTAKIGKNGEVELRSDGKAIIAGFEIGNGRIGAIVSPGSETFGNLALYKDFFRIGGNHGYAMFGNDVIPASAGGAFNAVGRIVNKHPNRNGGYGFDQANYGLFIDVEGGTKNFGIDSNSAIKASAFINTQVAFINLTSSSTGYTMDLSQHSIFLIHSTISARLTLPTESSMASQFGLRNLPNNFGFTFIIKARAGSQTIRIDGIHNENESETHYSIAQGDSLILLVTKHPTFRYNIINYSY